MSQILLLFPQVALSHVLYIIAIALLLLVAMVVTGLWLAFRGGFPDEPIKLTEENLEVFRKQFPHLTVITFQRCPICQSFLITRMGPIENEDGVPLPIHGTGLNIRCPNCQRRTVRELIPDNENPVMVVHPHRPDWVHCPHCGTTFKLTNPASWDGKRHTTCGQKLAIGSLSDSG